MSAPSPKQAPTEGSIPSQSDIAALDAAREKAISAWAENAIPRELLRIGKEPNGHKEWFRDAGIKDGEWMTSMKPQFEAGMRPSKTTSLKDRIWNCGMLATAGYKGELAVKQVQIKGPQGIRKVLQPFTSSDIRRELLKAALESAKSAGYELTEEQTREFYVSRQNFRRSIVELETEGKALRTLRDGRLLKNLTLEERQNLQEGEILLFFFFRPFCEKPGGGVVSKRLRSFAQLSPFQKVSQTLKTLGLRIDPQTVVFDDYLYAEVTAAAEDYEKDLAVAAETYRKAKTVVKENAKKRVTVAAQRPQLEKNVEKNEEKRTGAAAASQVSINDEGSSSSSTPEEKRRRTTTSSTNSQTGTVTARAREPEAPVTEIQEVGEAMAKYGPTDDTAVRKLVKLCLQQSPDATVAEVIAVIHEKGPQANSRETAAGFLLTAVPRQFEPNALARWRHDRANPQNRVMVAGGTPDKNQKRREEVNNGLKILDEIRKRGG